MAHPWSQGRVHSSRILSYRTPPVHAYSSDFFVSRTPWGGSMQPAPPDGDVATVVAAVIPLRRSQLP